MLLSLSFAASASAAARGAYAELAAHQILVGLYFCFAPVGDALSQTVQTFLPRSVVADAALNLQPNIEKRGSRALGPRSRAVVKGAVVTAAALGGVDALAAAALPTYAPKLFSGDPAVALALRNTAPYLGASLAVHGLSSAMEGTMLATGDAAVLGALYAADAAVVVSVFFALAKNAGALSAVWKTFLAYQLLRCSQFALRVAFTALRQPPPRPSDPQPA